MVGGFLELPGVAAGQKAGSRRRALGVGGVSVGEKNSLGGDAVEGRRRNPARPVGAHVRVGGIVGDREEDVRTLRGRGRRAGGKGEEGADACTADHDAPQHTCFSTAECDVNDEKSFRRVSP